MVHPRPTANKPHVCLLVVLIAISLALMDGYLVQQNPGPKKVGVCVTVLAGDTCFVIVLRYVAIWAGSEVQTARRGYAMILWFFYIFILEIKVYFVYQNYKSQDLASGAEGLETGVSRFALTLLLSLWMPVVFITMAAIDQLDYLQPYKKREEIRSRLFWVVLDLLDVVDVQANLWELQKNISPSTPTWVEGLIFFYCYILLLVLPCVSLSKISMQGVNIVPHKMMLYPVLSLATINVVTLLIRGGNLLIYGDIRVSGIMMGKNVMAIIVKICSFVEYRSQPASTADPGAKRQSGKAPALHGFDRRAEAEMDKWTNGGQRTGLIQGPVVRSGPEALRVPRPVPACFGPWSLPITSIRPRTGGSAGGFTATMAAAADAGRVRVAALPPNPDPGSGSDGPAETDVRVPVPMNLFATWEIERSTPSCVPRLCSLTLKKLMVFRQLDKEPSSIIIAVKIQGSKRTLRSSEYLLPADGLMETELELTFSLQYLHFLKRDANRLHVMLQRRKRYKNRTIRGYKTLAAGVVNMAEVMQHPTDGAHSLCLHSNLKDALVRAAEISVLSLSSQPIEQEDTSSHHDNKTKASDQSLDMENYWEDDDDSFSSEQEGSDDAVPPQDMYEDDDDVQGKVKKTHRTQQPNFKQKFVALLKRFKVSDEVLDADPVGQSQENEEDLDLLYDSLDVYNPSDSGPELDDNDSILSTPKPKLRPFFEGLSQSSSQTEIGSLPSQRSHQREQSAALTLSNFSLSVVNQAAELLPAEDLDPRGPDESRGEEAASVDDEEDVAMGTEADLAAKLCKTESQIHLSPSKTGSQVSRHQWNISMKDRQNSKGTDRTSSVDSETSSDSRIQPSQGASKSVLDQLNHILFSEDQVPESIILINTADWQGQYLSEVLFEQPIVCTVSTADVQAAFSAIISRIQRFCNCNSQTPPTVKVVVCGDQSFLSTVLCCFVEQLASKTPDWLNHLRFLIVPVGAPPLAKFLASLDAKFNSLFMDGSWRELFGRPEPPPHGINAVGVAGRVSQYLCGAVVSHLFPISEAMLTCKHKSREDDSCQKFVPFIGLVKVGIVEQNFLTTSVDSDDITLGSPPSQSGALTSISSTPPLSPSTSCPGEVMGLQVDYWSSQGGGAGERRKEVGIKNTLKSNFRCLQVSRLSGGELMSMTVVTKEKNKKVMFLSKKTKEKEAESRSQLIEGISRLICTSKHQHTLRVSVDGVEWNNVKFFQLAAQWPTHVKHFPVGIFGYNKP
ncbi:hypothetical protein Q5P01_025814 [Channa striata]|uniref:Uncharacterized protein n=1 Tax=Channa striata TaxID=64152 RepID=A0AA88IXI4_CHASR|nr:hypothetical protein Q5P01_025814 [Channa striata]